MSRTQQGAPHGPLLTRGRAACVPSRNTPLLTTSRARRKARGSFSARKVPAEASFGRTRRERKGEREAGAGARLRSRGSPAPAALPGPVLPGSRGPWLCSVSSRTVPCPGKFGGRRGLVLGAQSPLSGGEEERGRSGRVRTGPWGSGVPRTGSALCAPRSPRAGASGAAGAGRRAGRGGLRGGGGEGGRPPPGEGCHWPAASSGAGEEVVEAEPPTGAGSAPRALGLRGNFGVWGRGRQAGTFSEKAPCLKKGVPGTETDAELCEFWWLLNPKKTVDFAGHSRCGQAEPGAGI